MLKACHCRSEFQDAQYGKGIRVHTEGKKGEAHCTVCGPKPSWEQKLASCARNWLPIHNPE